MILLTVAILMLLGIIYTPEFRERPSKIIVGFGVILFIASFGFMFYAIIHSFSDSLSSYEFFPDKLVVHKTFGDPLNELIIYYKDIVKIKAYTPLMGNIPKDYYADFKITTIEKSYDIQSVEDYEEILLLLFEQTANIRNTPIMNLFADPSTALFYSQVGASRKLRN